MEAKLYDMAAALYDGGWRASDAEALLTEYEWTEDSDEFQNIIKILNQIEEENKK